MAKRENTLSLADKYDLSDLEPDADHEKAAEYLAAGSQGKKPDPNPTPKRNPTTQTDGHSRVGTFPETQPAKPEPWTSRTIRLRQSTATALTKAACGQKTKHVEGKLMPGAPLTVQDIADRGIRLALTELGYTK